MELIYGDAYLFKVLLGEVRLEDGGTAATYVDLDLNFIFALGLGVSVSAILRECLIRQSEIEEQAWEYCRITGMVNGDSGIDHGED